MLRLSSGYGGDLGYEYAIGFDLDALALVQRGVAAFLSPDLSGGRIGGYGGPQKTAHGDARLARFVGRRTRIFGIAGIAESVPVADWGIPPWRRFRV